MSWIGKLYETYQNCLDLVGKTETEQQAMLMPIAHTTQNAHIELILNMEGKVLRGTARVIQDKADSVTIIPCTEKSQSRSGSAPIHHPLFDKLQYLAGDYTTHGGEKGDKFHKNYMADLRAFCASPYATDRLRAVLRYLEQGSLVSDLIAEGILPTDENGKLIRSWDSKRYGEKRGVYMAGSALDDGLDAFVRIDVRDPEKPLEQRLWNDPELWEAHIAYYTAQESEKELCYVQGIPIPSADMSPSKLRSSGDKAKLISSNDSSGFTYRGRFTEANQVARLGYETTQKAHNALKWLIAKQGIRNGEQVYVCWGTKDEPTLPIGQDSLSLMEEEFGTPEKLPYVHTDYAIKLKEMMQGYRNKIDERADIVLLGLDSATPGRLSIIFYEELDRKTYLERLETWYSSCTWRLDYIKKDGQGRPIGIFGTPSPKDILFAVYGPSASDKLKKSAMQRLMPCILSGKRLPPDFVRSAARRASEPVAMEPWEYWKTLSVACALIRKYKNDKSEGENYSMELKQENDDRSYLFGRLLAYYHYLESIAQTEARYTNAMRLKTAFSRRPARTVLNLDEKLQPYLKRIYGKADKKLMELHELTGKIKFEDMTNEPLDPTYLLGYSSQLTKLYEKKGEAE